MIRMIPSKSADHAKAYYTDALSKSDYYTGNDQELPGQFHGRLAARLGLAGPVTKETFFALCENKNPLTGEALTPRTKAERVIGYDVNFHGPKSLSILNFLAPDAHIQDAFQEAVSETMQEIEEDAKTRVRVGGVYADRETGELIWGEFLHQTARPVKGHTSDPHLHAHCFVINATFDEKENKVKAAKFRDINISMPYYQTRFHKRLADKMVSLGYKVRRTNHSFEIEGVPKKVIEHFSKRTNAIGQVAKERGITDAKQLDALGARTRAKKKAGASMSELKADWLRQIKELGTSKDDMPVRYVRAPYKIPVTAKQCVDHAISHVFERSSTKSERRVLEQAYRQAIGETRITLDDITDCFLNDKRILSVQQGSQIMCTTRKVFLEEMRMVELARQGQGKVSPLYPEAPDYKKLKGQQADAATHVLTNTHRVSIILGQAGTGKTETLKELVHWIEKAGKQVKIVAPTAEASRGVLRSEGFKNAETVAKLLTDPEEQKGLTRQVLIVDEAGLLATKEMTALLELADKKKCRLVLVGDTRQHNSVARGDALRILNTVGGIPAAEVSKIYRQKDAQYKDAVENLAKGNIKDAFEKLDSIGSIKTIDPMNPYEQAVEDYCHAVKQGQSVLVVSPTHKAGEQFTVKVRERLRQEGRIGKKEITFRKYMNLNFTDAQKADWQNYEEGHIVQFNQNVPGFKRGSLWTVKETRSTGIYIKDQKGRIAVLPRNKASYFDVSKKSEIGLSKGDTVRITRNGFDDKKRRLNNGQMLEVVSVNKRGKILLRNTASKARYILDKNYGHIAHAYCITSHASQGKTVDTVLIVQPASTFPATDLKQFYVSVSRGRHAVKIYTDDKAALLEHASEMGDRQSALELAESRDKHLSYIQQKIKEQYNQHREPAKENKDKSYNPPPMDMDYEP